MTDVLPFTAIDENNKAFVEPDLEVGEPTLNVEEAVGQFNSCFNNISSQDQLHETNKMVTAIICQSYHLLTYFDN